MYAPHTVTIYNVVQEIDPTTLDEAEKVYTTILRGVMLQASKGVNVRESGLESADAVNLYIPFAVEAVDGVKKLLAETCIEYLAHTGLLYRGGGRICTLPTL